MTDTETTHLLHRLNYRMVTETDDRVVMEMDNRPDLTLSLIHISEPTRPY